MAPSSSSSRAPPCCRPASSRAHALRDAAAARQAAALKTTEEEEAQAIRRATASGPALHEPDELSRLIAARRQAVQETRAALAAIADPALKAQLTEDLKAEEASLRALEARAAARTPD